MARNTIAGLELTTAQQIAHGLLGIHRHPVPHKGIWHGDAHACVCWPGLLVPHNLNSKLRMKLYLTFPENSNKKDRHIFLCLLPDCHSCAGRSGSIKLLQYTHYRIVRFGFVPQIRHPRYWVISPTPACAGATTVSKFPFNNAP